MKIESKDALQKLVKQPVGPYAIHRFLPSWFSTRDTELEVRLHSRPFGSYKEFIESKIEASDVAYLINRFRGRLEHLRVDCNSFRPTYGDNNNKALLAKAIASSPNLVSLCIEGDRYYAVLGKAVEQLRWLETVEIPCHFTSLLPLLAQPNSVLRRIKIHDAIRDPTSVQQFFDACQASTILEELHFDIDYFDPLHLEALRGLIRNGTTLKCLILEDSIEELPVPITVLIKTQLTLTDIADDLKFNRSLRKFGIKCGEASDEENYYEPRDYPSEAASFYSMLLHNHHLAELELGSWKFEFPQPSIASAWDMTREMFPSGNQDEKFRFHLANIHFLLSLNKSGRGNVMGSSATKPTDHDWINAMADNEDLSVVYYFLRANPMLCKIAPKVTATNSTNWNGKKRKRSEVGISPYKRMKKTALGFASGLASFLPTRPTQNSTKSATDEI